MVNSFKVITKSFDELSKQELYQILQLRMEVFCVEQNCSYQDIDGLDENAQHFYITDNSSIVVYARVSPPQVNICHIGRIVVAKKYRNKKAASKIVKTAIEYCQIQFKNSIIEISAQSYLSDFYKSLDFKSVNNFYLEDDIPHELMQIKPN